MNRQVFRGIFPPTVTSFTSSGDIDETGIRRNVDFLLKHGVHGLFIIGSYGSFPLMTFEERRRAAEIFLKAVDGRVPVFIQIGAGATSHAINLAKHAEDIGAAAVASVVPFYYSSFAYTADDILTHFEKLIASVKIPVYLYNNPKTTGYNVTPQLLRRLIQVGLKGVKDSSGDYTLMAGYLNAASDVPDFAGFVGTVGLLLPALQIGAPGCVAGTANVYPELIVAVWDAFQRRDFETAMRLQKQALLVREIQVTEGFRPSACYSMLRMRGIEAGTCRAPWRELSKESLANVRTELERAGLSIAAS